MVIKRIKWLYYFLIYLLLYAYHYAVSRYPGDDIFYSKAPNTDNIIHWLINRYYTWSGRMFPDAMEFLLLRNGVWFWRIINPVLIMLLAYGLVRIWKKKAGFIEFLTALVLLGYLKNNVLSSGFFWITGSMNYLWPITLGLLAMIPYADHVFRKEGFSSQYKYIFTLISGFLAAIGNEQVALCMSCFAILTHITLLRQKRGIDKKLLLLTIIIMAGSCILLFAPGNHIRWGKEVAYWFPGFGNLSIKDHFYIGTVWGFGKLFLDMKNMILLLSSFAILLSFKDKEITESKVFKLYSLLFTLILLLQLTGLGSEQLYGFDKIKNFRFSSTIFSFAFLNKHFIIALLPYIFWSVYGIISVYLLLKNSKHQTFGLFAFLAVLATLAVMFFSPTIYGSGNRVLTVGSILIILVLVGRIVESKLINTLFPLCVLGLLPIINLFDMLYLWIAKGFNPFL